MHGGPGRRSSHSKNADRKSHQRAGVKTPESSGRVQHRQESGMCVRVHMNAWSLSLLYYKKVEERRFVLCADGSRAG